MKKEKKYIIELNEKQARLLSWALDTFPRLIGGQDYSYQNLFESAWERRCEKATGSMMEALKDAFRKDGGNEYRKVINSLYRDLEKLL